VLKDRENAGVARRKHRTDAETTDEEVGVVAIVFRVGAAVAGGVDLDGFAETVFVDVDTNGTARFEGGLSHA
jgi:hypothetical protein